MAPPVKHYANRDSDEVVQRARAFVTAYEALCREYGFHLASRDDTGYDGPHVLPLVLDVTGSLVHAPHEPYFDSYDWVGPEDADPDNPPIDANYNDYRVRALGLPPLSIPPRADA